MIPRPPPACPAPNVRIARKKITVVELQIAGDQVVSSNYRYALIGTIPFEHFIAKIKEGRYRKYVVLQNNAFRLLLKEPSDTA
jgi:hypothetical protein